MSKTKVVVIILILIAIAAVLLRPTSPPSELDEANISSVVNDITDNTMAGDVSELTNTLNNVEVIITGYGPGKVHPGGFSDYLISNLSLDDSGLVTSGEVVVRTDSLDFGINKLNSDLCKEGYLNCVKYPEITFELSKVEQDSNGEFLVTGNLTLLGVTKSVSFPVGLIMNESGEPSYATDFRLDVASFGFNPIGVDDEVRIEIRER